MSVLDFLRKKADEIEDYQRQLDARRAASASAPVQRQPRQAVAAGDVILQVEDTFMITGRGTVVVGRCQNPFAKGDEVFLVNPDGTGYGGVVDGIEKFRQMLSSAQPGDNVGVMLRSISKAQIQKGAKLYRR